MLDAKFLLMHTAEDLTLEETVQRLNDLGLTC